MQQWPDVEVLTPSRPEQSCGIAIFHILSMPPPEVARLLYEQHRIFTVAIDTEEVKGVRVTPHLFTTTAQLDRFLLAVQAISGISPATPPALRKN